LDTKRHAATSVAPIFSRNRCRSSVVARSQALRSDVTLVPEAEPVPAMLPDTEAE
jgi:hypothetical protein